MNLSYLLLVSVLSVATASSVISIDANSVDTFISNYDYLVLLFFDGSSASDAMRRDWDEIAKVVRGKDTSIELGAVRDIFLVPLVHCMHCIKCYQPLLSRK
jgi:uncharacterized membrane protein YeiH